MMSSLMSEKEHEQSSQLEEYSQLLDNKAARIRQLERQLRELVADGDSGSKNVSVPVVQSVEVEGVLLETGQNLLQVHLNQVR